MAIISSYRNALVALANRYNGIGWVCDLVCKAIQNDGKFADEDINQIADSLMNDNQATLTPPANAKEEIVPSIVLKSLKHVCGVNALEPNQDIIFCPNQFTLIYGLNGSGKTSYFKLLNNIASGLHKYEIRNNIFNPAPVQEVHLSYNKDGVDSTFVWNSVAPGPDCLKYVRVFDSNYANELLQVQDNGDFIFQSFTLGIYRGIANVVDELKKRDLTIPPAIEADLRGLCSPAYQQLLIRKLTEQFDKEKNVLGLNDIEVTMEIDDLLNHPSIYLHIQNHYYPNDILSEGELKGVALAMFLAECEIQTVKTPLIFDDPVNSLDSRIMHKFVRRLKELPNQVIIFTHNLQFKELLFEDKKLFKLFPNNFTAFDSTVRYRYVYGYKLRFDSKGRTGIVKSMAEQMAGEVLDEADVIIADVNRNAEESIPYLRYAIENMVDEIIFKKQTPLKYRGRSYLQWNEYKRIISLPPNVIDVMEDAYNQLSNAGNLHLGATAIAAPLTRVDLQNISTTLRTMILNYS